MLSPSHSVCLAHSQSDLDAVSRDCLAVPTAENEMMSAQMQPSTLLFRPGLNYSNNGRHSVRQLGAVADGIVEIASRGCDKSLENICNHQEAWQETSLRTSPDKVFGGDKSSVPHRFNMTTMSR